MEILASVSCELRIDDPLRAFPGERKSGMDEVRRGMIVGGGGFIWDELGESLARARVGKRGFT